VSVVLYMICVVNCVRWRSLELDGMCQESGCAGEYVRFNTCIVSKSDALPLYLVMVSIFALKHLERALWLDCVETFLFVICCH